VNFYCYGQKKRSASDSGVTPESEPESESIFREAGVRSRSRSQKFWGSGPESGVKFLEKVIGVGVRSQIFQFNLHLITYRISSSSHFLFKFCTIFYFKIYFLPFYQIYLSWNCTLSRSPLPSQ